MAELQIRVNPEQRLAYIPKAIHKILGNKPNAVTGRKAVLFYPENADIADVARSLKVIAEDLQDALELANKEEKCQT